MDEERLNDIDRNSLQDITQETSDNSETKEGKNKKISFQERKAMVWNLMGGSILEEQWMQKNWKLFVLIGIMSIINIYNNYHSIGQIREIAHLEEELKDYQYRSLFISSEITAREQKDEIEKNIQQMGLGLESSSTAPYILFRNPKKGE